jgi:hypothetical protein
MSTVCRTSAFEPARVRLPLLARFAKAFQASSHRLDVESLPDYLRRDLGLADGRTSPPRDPLRD